MAGKMGRRALYKDTLQPALHRRFTSTAALLLAISYVEAVMLADWSSYFWSWFPLSATGARTVLIFACGLAILILRIAHYHVGVRTTASGLHSLGAALFRPQTYETSFWYGVSSLIYSFIFLTSAPKVTRLHWITYVSGDRARLNERPIFLACFMAICALTQTFVHYKRDLDCLELRLPRSRAGEGRKASATFRSSLRAALMRYPGIFIQSLQLSFFSFFATVLAYLLFLRGFAWSFAMAFLSPFFSLPKSRILPPWSLDIFPLFGCFAVGIYINFLWSSGNIAFSVFMVKEPLKDGKPLTSDSKDPNGSLLSGLKSKKLSVKSFAMWELALIANDFEARRRAIYSDIDRKDGTVWSQVHAACTELLTSVEARVDDYDKPAPPASAQAPAAAAAPRQRSSTPLRDGDILNQRAHASGLAGGMGKAWEHLSRSPGQSAMAELSPLAKKTWREAKDRMLSKDQKAALAPDRVKGKIEGLAAKMLSVGCIGSLLRQDFDTRLAAIVLGSPLAEPTLYLHATESLCQLAVHSLTEDEYGNVHRDVASIVRTLTAVILKVEALKAKFPGHWTDPSEDRKSPTVDALLECLRTGLHQVVCTFEPYRGDVQLSLGDMRLAREAATKPEVETPTTAVPLPRESLGEAGSPELRRKAGPRRTHQKVEMEQVR